jgi:hypothetical protein
MRQLKSELIVAVFTCLILFAFIPMHACAVSLEFGNEQIRRVFVQNDGEFHTTEIINAVARETTHVGGREFEILFMDGSTVTSDKMAAKSDGVSALPGGGKQLTVSFSSEKLKVRATYAVRPGVPVMRKTLYICGVGDDRKTVDRVRIEAFQVAAGATHGGLGQPVFMGNVFMGLESPAGYNLVEEGAIHLQHFPGWNLSTGCGTSYTAAIGVAVKGQVEEYFQKYVDSFRYTTRSMLLYNSWFDVQGIGMSANVFKRIFDKFRKGLGKYGVSLDYLVVDDGWQNRDSIWETYKVSFPRDFGPLRDYLEAGGTKLGIWLPLCGYGLNAKWGRDRGLEADVKNRYYCMAGPRFNEALRERLKNIVQMQGGEYFKHDFNFLECYNPNVSYPQTQRHSFEANVNAEEGLLDYLHSLNQKTYLNVTSYMWLSPWWLSHADTLWVGSGDYGYDYGAASLEPRDWAMTYRDGWLHRRLVEEGARYPINAIMTHGIIDGVLNRLGGKDEGFRTWADNVVLYFGLGLYMRELYISPQLLEDRKWKFLAQAAKWAKENDDVFARTAWVGGDPKKGQAYGYHHFGGGRDLFVLRNPGMTPQALKLPKGRWAFFQQIYPALKTYRSNRDVTLYGHDVIVLRGMGKDDCLLPVPLGVEYELIESNANRTIYRVFTKTAPDIAGRSMVKSIQFTKSKKPALSLVASDRKRLCTIEGNAYVCRSRAYVTSGATGTFQAAFYSDDDYLMNRIEINGTSVDGIDKGRGWRLFKMDIPTGTHDVTVRIPVTSIRRTAFAARKYRFEMHLESENGAPTGRLIIKHTKRICFTHTQLLPPVRSSGKSRRVISLPAGTAFLIDFDSPAFSKEATITSADLKTVTAAKLRFRTFGTRGDVNIRTVFLNHSPVGSLPANDFPFDFWQSFVIDLPPTVTQILKTANIIEISNTMGGAFKIKDVSLAVRLADGTWRTTNMANDIQSSSKEWQFSEGSVFGSRSKPFKLNFK